ncbi:MAG: putative phage tail assembly chaperone [Desulfotalea sp.]
MSEQKIEIKLNGKKIYFEPTVELQEKYINETLPNNKVAPLHNFLMRSVCPESKEALKPFLLNPAHTMMIGEKVGSAFIPELKIEMGK